MKKNKLSGRDGDRGFTLVELLVVIVIVAILAAIAIPIFFNQKDKALRAQVVTGLRDAATIMSGWGTENNGNYAPEPPATSGLGTVASDMAFLQSKGWDAADTVSLDIARADALGFCLQATHSQVGTLNLQYASGAGVVEDGPCA